MRLQARAQNQREETEETEKELVRKCARRHGLNTQTQTSMKRRTDERQKKRKRRGHSRQAPTKDHLLAMKAMQMEIEMMLNMSRCALISALEIWALGSGAPTQTQITASSSVHHNM